MNIFLFLSYSIVLFIYNFFPNRINILNSGFNELIIRVLGFIFGVTGLFLQRKDDLFSIENMFVFYVVILLAITFVLLIAFVGNKIDYSKLFNINQYDIITSLLSIFIMSYCFIYYGEFDIYPFSSGFLFIINILFCLWLIALWVVTIQSSNNKSPKI